MRRDSAHLSLHSYAPRSFSPQPYPSWHAKSEHVRTIDGIIDWLRELWKLREMFAADPVTAKLLAA
jgi:hypothetical protein